LSQAALVLAAQAWMPTPSMILGQFGPVTGPFAYVGLLVLVNNYFAGYAPETLRRLQERLRC
jgi:hypothetical protein